MTLNSEENFNKLKKMVLNNIPEELRTNISSSDLKGKIEDLIKKSANSITDKEQAAVTRYKNRTDLEVRYGNTIKGLLIWEVTCIFVLVFSLYFLEMSGHKISEGFIQIIKIAAIAVFMKTAVLAGMIINKLYGED